MSNEFEYDIFLSYSSKDWEIVHALAERLKQSGLRVWLDAWAIRPGDLIPLKIQHGLEQSRTLLMCMSPAYFDSEWGKLEHLTLIFRDPTNVLRRFIPILIADCEPPYIIAQFARIDWQTPSDKAYASLLAACQEVETAKPQATRKLADQARMVLKGHSLSVCSVAITPDGRTAVSGSMDNTLKVWDLLKGKCRITLEDNNNNNNNWVIGVAVTTDERTAVSVSDTTLKVWDLASRKCRATLKGHAKLVWCLAITPDGRTAVSGSTDTLKVWDLVTGECRSTLEGHTCPVNAVAITPDGRTAISGSSDKTVKVWDLASRKCHITLQGHARIVCSVAITADGLTAVSCSSDKTLKVWDLAKGKCRDTLEGHADEVVGLAITPDGRTAISGSLDKTLKVWDLTKGKCRATLEGHAEIVRCVAITPDGRIAVSGSYDQTLRVWNLPEP